MKCAKCGKTVRKQWYKELVITARKDSDGEYPEIIEEQRITVCNHCYKPLAKILYKYYFE